MEVVELKDIKELEKYYYNTLFNWGISLFL